MSSPAITSRKSSRLEIQAQSLSPVSRKSNGLSSALSQPPASPAVPTSAARKSEKLATVLAPSPSIRKSGRLLKLDIPNPVGITRSRKPSSSLVGLKEGSISSETKKKREKKEKSIEMLQTETREVPTDYELHCMPLKRRLDGHSYKALYKTQRTRIRTADSDQELRMSATIHRIVQFKNVDNGTTSTQFSGDKKDLGEELCCHVVEDLRKDLPEVICEGPSLESHSGLNESNAHPIIKNVEDIDESNAHPIIKNVEDIASIRPENEGNKEGLDMQASETVTPSTSSATENPDFVANCFLCSKKRRLVFDSLEEELCSCTNTLKGNFRGLSCQKSSKESFVKLQKLPMGGFTTTGESLMNNVNRLREFRHKNQNAVVVDETERMVNVIAFIFSLSDVHKPFLVTGTPDTLSQWEAEFIRLKPSINVVVYYEDRGTKNSIRSLEFHRDEGGEILQVLLCSVDVISEDFQILKHLKCEILLLDECQNSMNFDLLKMLDADMRILLFSGPLKVDNGSLQDKRDDYLSALSFLYHPGELDKVDDCLKCDENDSLVKILESFSRFIAYDSCKFVEYWVPVPLSKLQLEQYCHTLHSGSSALTSNMKNNIVGEKVHDVLMTVRKCCDHPYVADQKLVASRMQQNYTPSENVDYGIKASGKLHLLCKLLSKIKSHKLRALVLYQPFDGSRESFGDMLEDLLRDRFGADQYERIDRHVHQSKKQAAVNRFSKEDCKQFVFLLENRACHPWIKLSVDVVVILSSEWAPSADIRTLERLTFISRTGKVPIFRLYCSCTIEEKALILGKQLPILNVKNVTTSSTLLMWGAISLFSRLEDYHANSSDDVSSEHALLDDVVNDLMAILSDTTAISESPKNSSAISKAFIRSGNGIYHTNRPLLGERKDQLNVVEEHPILFWKKLLEGRSPRWKFSHGPPIRKGKRVLYSDELSKNPKMKRKKMDDTSVNANNSPVEPDANKEREIVGSEKDALVTSSTNRAQLPSSSSHRKSFSHQNSVYQSNNGSPSDEQQSLHDFLKAKIAKLWKALKLSEDVLHTIHTILEHLMENHNISKDDPNVLQAFQMSLCWIAADMLGQKFDKKGSLLEARKILNFECPEDLADSVYKKLTLLKKTFPQPPAKSTEEPRLKVEIEDISLYTDLQQNQEPKNYVYVTKNHKKLRKVQKKIEKLKSRLLQKHNVEIHEFNKIWKLKREKLEEEHKVESAVVSAIHNQSTMKMDKLKATDTKFEIAIKDLEQSMEGVIKELEKKHAAEVDEENRKCEKWLADAEKYYGGGGQSVTNTHESESIANGNEPMATKPDEPVLTSDYQIDNAQFDPHANIIDSIDGASRSDSHAVEGGNILISEQSAEAQPQNIVDDNAREPHKQPEDSHTVEGGNIIISEQSAEAQPQNIVDGNAGEPHKQPEDNANTVDSQIHALPEVVGTVLPVGSNLDSHQLNESSQNPASVSRVSANAVESEHQPILQSGPVPGPSSVELPHHQPTRPRVLADPLQYEIEKIWKDREQVIKLHEDTRLQLRTECEKELIELSTQIRSKYAAKMNETESMYLMKRTEIEANQCKVFMNLLLAEAFRSKCLDFRPSGSSLPQPGVASGFFQPQEQLSLQSLSRHSPVIQPASMHHQTTYPIHRYPGVGSSSSSLNLSSQSVLRSSNISGTPYRPPPLQISSFTPNIGSSRVGPDIRAPPPHLQPFRQGSSASIHPLPMPPQQPAVAHIPRSLVIPPVRVSEGDTGHVSAVELLRSTSIQSGGDGGGQGDDTVSLPVPVLNNKEGDVSDYAAAMSSLPSDLVCLSDDDDNC